MTGWVLRIEVLAQGCCMEGYLSEVSRGSELGMASAYVLHPPDESSP